VLGTYHRQKTRALVRAADTHLLEHLDRRLRALAPLLGHRRHGRAEHARDARGAVVEGHGVHAHLHHRKQLVHDVRRRRDHDGVAVPAHRQARQLVHDVQVHGLLCHEIAKDLLDLDKYLAGIVLDDALAKGLEALEPGLRATLDASGSWLDVDDDRGVVVVEEEASVLEVDSI
jgi:hypothetical protein